MQPVSLSNTVSLQSLANGATSSTSLFTADDASAPADLFSQLLGGFDTGQGQNPAHGRAANELLPSAKVNILAAQEIPGQLLVGSAGQIASLLAQSITPEDAGKLVAKLDAIGSSGGDSSGLQQQMKDQLKQLAQGDETKTVSQIIDALQADSEASPAITTAALGAPANPALASNERGGVVQRALHLLSSVITKNKSGVSSVADDMANATPDLSVDPNLQSLQAASFRPDVGTVAAAEDSAPDKKTEQVEIVLVNQQVLVPQWVNAIAPQPLPPVRADLDSVIPPLVNANTAPVALPQVSLPQLNPQAIPAADTTFAQQLSHAGEGTVKAGDDKTTLLKEGTDSPFNPGATNGALPTQTAAAVQPTTPILPPHVVNHAPVSEQVHVAISRAKHDGIDELTIQLDPLHLGRIEVKMHTNSDGQTQISFIADKPDTFDALSRDARSLEQSLQEAGIKADAGSMQFNLRQQPQPQLNANLSGERNESGKNARDGDDDKAKSVGPLSAIAPATHYYTLNLQDGVDIHA